jgi:hypothetical protein
VATAVAALKARARREIQHHFFQADAVRPDRAVSFTPDNHLEKRQFARYREAGVIHEVGPGRYWLDIPAYDQALRARHERVRLALGLVILAMLAISVAASLSGHVR